jgi:general secretion pathway protein C
MGLLIRNLGKILTAIIVLGVGAAILLVYDLQRTLRMDTALPPPQTPVAARQQTEEPPRLKPEAQYELIAKRNLFVFPKEAAPQAESKETPQQETSLDVRLKGTIVSPKGYAMAMIEDFQKREEEFYLVGDRIQGAEILEILKDQVIIDRGGTKESLKLFAEDSRRRDRGAPPARRPVPPAGPAGQRPQVARPAAVEGDRAIQQKIRSLMAQLRLRPHFDKGRPAGFTVGQVRQGSVFDASGLRSGDIIVAVNDEDVQTPNQLLKAYREIAEDEEIWLDVVRDGVRETVDIDLQGIIPEG